MEGVDFSKATAELEQWHIADTWRLKKYPCGYIAQGAIDAALRFREKRIATRRHRIRRNTRASSAALFPGAATGEFSGKFGYDTRSPARFSMVKW